MKGLSKCYVIFLLLTLSVLPNHADKQVYIVYMGSSRGRPASYHTTSQTELLVSVVERKEQSERPMIYSYTNGFSGFAAHLSEQEADMISKHPAVVSVFRDPVLQLHTTRSWEFLQDQLSPDRYHDYSSNSESPSSGSDTIIGILDTGIWPELPSFDDKGMGPIPVRWKGVCMTAKDFSSSNCNKKLIGARYYANESMTDQTPRDSSGHGTHTSSTAAGAAVPDASYHGLAAGMAKGGSPLSRLAVYRVCTPQGCRGSAVLAAFHDAIADGVDVLSLSLGANGYFIPDLDNDPLAIGAFHAVENGITVVCSAGNDGPTSGTVVNAAPWILTVGATTIDRDFKSDLILGDGNTVIKGEGINFSNLGKAPNYPLISGGSAVANAGTTEEASNCYPYALDGEKIKGKIILCEHRNKGYSKREKMEGVKGLGGIGLVLIDDLERYVAPNSGSFPMTLISSIDANTVYEYLNNSSESPVATILPTVTVNNYKPAPQVAYFSSRGPSTQTRNLIKPDIGAPGVSILAAFIPSNGSSQVSAEQTPALFNVLSGSSMACPHISGVAANIKSQHPTWSPAAIKSAIMTSATDINMEGNPIRNDGGSTAMPYDYGSGQVNPSKALHPGLVYEVSKEDYYLFLCNHGYSSDTIQKISGKRSGYNCPPDSGKDLISNLNYPSIAITKFNGTAKTVKRSVSNVDSDDEGTIYTVDVGTTSDELKVSVSPNKLQFSGDTKTLIYEVTFSSTSQPPRGDISGSLTWTNGKYKVRTRFVVSP